MRAYITFVGINNAFLITKKDFFTLSMNLVMDLSMAVILVSEAKFDTDRHRQW
jgi:hypothetical protein